MINKRLFKDLELPKWTWIHGAILILFETAAALSVPLITRALIEQVGSGRTTPILVMLCGVMIGQAVLGTLVFFHLGKAGDTLIAALRTVLTKHALSLPMKDLRKRSSGEWVSRLISDTQAIRDLISDHSASLLSGIVQIVGSIAILWWLDWRLTAVLFSSMAGATLLIVPLAVKIRGLATTIQDETAKVSSRIAAAFQEMGTVKSLAAEASESRALAHRIDQLLGQEIEELRITAWIAPIMSLAFSGALVAILGYGGQRLAIGALSTGTLIAFVLYLFHVAIPIAQVAMFVTQFQRAMGSSKRIMEIIETPSEHRPAAHAIPSHQPLVIKQLQFAYPESDRLVFSGLNASFEPGTTTALVGRSGSGKSTLMNLLERFYEPTEGSIYWGSQSIDHWDIKAWRRKLGYVAQDAPLLPGTVRENLGLGMNKEPTDQMIWEALEQASAVEFVRSLEVGLDTALGERAHNISGGQRQRLAIARVVLRQPEILLMDEATAHLDSQTEADIQASLEKLQINRTIIIAAHRLATIKSADRILVLENGTVSAQGSHDVLVRTSASYAQWIQQQGIAC
ncbi:MAG: ABC transporter ATP-binding protein [Acidobacteria bacterium]|nr:ABC transporter ATP-binding protein [Acidobacteriota bacterium]